MCPQGARSCNEKWYVCVWEAPGEEAGGGVKHFDGYHLTPTALTPQQRLV